MKPHHGPFPNFFLEAFIRQFHIRLQTEDTVIFECEEMGI